MDGFKRTLLVLISSILLSIPVTAANLNESQFFARCYTFLTGRPVPLNSTTAAAVGSGTMTALDACNQILESAKFRPGDLGSEGAVESTRVLKRFYDFHRQWFAGQNVEDMTEYNDEVGIGTRDAYDTTEPALGLTYALFEPGFEYRNIFQGTQGFSAIRRDDPNTAARMGWTVSIPNRGRYGNDPGLNQQLFHYRAYSGPFSLDGSNSLIGTLPRIQTGELVGIERKIPTTPSTVPNVSLQPLGSDLRGNEEPGLKFNFDITQGLGGGILGMPIYVMMNFGHPRGLKMNGSVKMPRKWAEATLKTFWCASLPQLREVDAQGLVNASSSVPFRRANSCVSCHATLDQMSSVLRNALMVGSDYTIFTSGPNIASKLAFFMAQYSPEFPSQDTWLDDSNSAAAATFHRQQPRGKLLVRNLSGDLVDIQFMGLDGLGSIISSQDDFYQCTVKRYVEFMTGLSIPLYDVTDRRNAEAIRRQSTPERELRDFINKTALDLKASQSLLTMVKQLMASKYFRDRDYILGAP